GKTTLTGLRDYNNISACVCLVENHSDGIETKMHALGFGSYLVLNGHFFRKNNGYMIIKSHHGEFRVKNMKQLKIFGVDRKDMALLQLPKDFPPFPRKLRFRAPEKGESIVLVGNNFQDKYISSMVSESCKTFPRDAGGFWKHWISTKEGSCGQPLVSVRDGFIVGIHSLCSEVSEVNYHTSVADDFEARILAKTDSLEWEKNWFYNPNSVCWGGISIPDNKPDDIFRADKVAETLMSEIVSEQ
nr:NIa [Daphne virus Y]